MKVILEMLSYPFLVRALVVGVLVSLCASLLGVSLVLKRYSMIGDGLSHVGFGALAIATALNLAPLAVAVPVVVVAAFLLLRLSQNGKLKGDAAIALLSSSALAIGVMTVSMTSGMNTDVNNYMFGSILSLSSADLRLSLILSAAVLALFVLCYPRIFAVTFDETFSRATGVHTQAYNMLLAVLTAVTIVLGMRMMGALLISSLIIFPALTAMRVFGTFRSVTICAAVVSVVNFLLGMVLSYVLETPSGASVVVVDLVVFLLFCGVQRIQCRVKKNHTHRGGPPGPPRFGIFSALHLLKHFLTQVRDDALFEPADVALGDAQQVRDFFLRRLARAADAEAQQDDLPVALAECLDGAQEHGALRVVLERAAHGVGVRAENVREQQLVAVPVGVERLVDAHLCFLRAALAQVHEDLVFNAA